MILKELSRNVFHCSVINVRLPNKCKTDLWVSLTCAVSDSFDILSCCFLFVKNFFNFFQVCHFSTFFQKQLWYLITVISQCQALFKSFFIERRRRDLNPRTAQTVYTLSRGTSSATWVLLQLWFSLTTREQNKLYQIEYYLSTTFFIFFI